jgi:hypothetical protein
VIRSCYQALNTTQWSWAGLPGELGQIKKLVPRRSTAELSVTGVLVDDIGVEGSWVPA